MGHRRRRGILAAEKPDAIVVMLGLDDRGPIHEPAAEKSDKPADKKGDKEEGRPRQTGSEAWDEAGWRCRDGQARGQAGRHRIVAGGCRRHDAPPVIAPEKSTRSPNGIYQFREERWVELYTKKIEDMIAVLKSKGVPVLWVGLPAVRGPKAMSDMLFLDSLYRDAAGKAGITYVDVWDGFVDEAGRYVQQGPDFEGQPRRLRSYDGVYFTTYGARKLAHYVEREINRLLAARSGPIALPTEPATPDANALPGQPAPRPLAGPILPLVASSVGTDQLLGGPGSRPAPVDALAARTLVKGEALAPPAGRADDDFAWPRREVGRERPRAKRRWPPLRPMERLRRRMRQALRRSRRSRLNRARHESEFFGFGNAQRRPAPQQPQPRAPGAPRPPADVGRSASAPDSSQGNIVIPGREQSERARNDER